MKKWALIPLFAVFVLFGASLTFTQTKRSQHGVVNVPYSTQEMPWDVGIRAHTNHLIMVRPDLTGSSPSGETPGSLSCVYQTVSGNSRATQRDAFQAMGQNGALIAPQRQPARSHLSFAFASAMGCHCMLVVSSAPPQTSART